MLNRCLACLPNVLVLSEVNPLGCGGDQPGPPETDIQRQAREWFGLDPKGTSFSEVIGDLCRQAAARQHQLIVRDWTYVNFFPSELNGNNPPYRFLTREELERINGEEDGNASSNDPSDLKVFALTRDAIDVWISRNTPPATEFFPHYLRYAERLVAENIPRFKYEAFCASPGRALQDICRATGLPYDESWRSFPTYTNVYGDSHPGKKSRGFSEAEIISLPRKKIGLLKVKEVNACAEMVEANRLLGYPAEY